MTHFYPHHCYLWDQAIRPKTSIFIRFSSGIWTQTANFYPHREEAFGRIFGGPVNLRLTERGTVYLKYRLVPPSSDAQMFCARKFAPLQAPLFRIKRITSHHVLGITHHSWYHPRVHTCPHSVEQYTKPERVKFPWK